MTWLRNVSMQLFVALGLSLVLWTFVTLTTNPDRETTYGNIPLDVDGLLPDMIIVDEDGLPRTDQANLSTVSVDIKTDQTTLATLSQSDLVASVSLGELGAGEHTVPIDVSSTRRNVTILDVAPAQVAIRLDQVITQTVPISVQIEGAPPFSYERDEPQVRMGSQPITETLVSGPQSQVERVASAAASVDVREQRVTFASTLPLQARDANGDPVAGVRLTPEAVNVRVEVRSVVSLKRVPVLGNVVGLPAPGYVVAGVESDPPLINLVGSSSLLTGIERIETEPIDISGAISTITREVGLRFQGAQRQEGQPGTATVTVQIAAFDQPFQARVPVAVAVVGAGAGLETQVEPPEIEIALEGSIGSFVELRSEQLVATVNVAEFGPGAYVMQPVVVITTTENVRVAGAVPQVTVSLRAPSQPRRTPTPALTETNLIAPTSQPPNRTLPPDSGVEPAVTPGATPLEGLRSTPPPALRPTAESNASDGPSSNSDVEPATSETPATEEPTSEEQRIVPVPPDTPL